MECIIAIMIDGSEFLLPARDIDFISEAWNGIQYILDADTGEILKEFE